MRRPRHLDRCLYHPGLFCCLQVGRDARTNLRRQLLFVGNLPKILANEYTFSCLTRYCQNCSPQNTAQEIRKDTHVPGRTCLWSRGTAPPLFDTPSSLLSIRTDDGVRERIQQITRGPYKLALFVAQADAMWRLQSANFTCCLACISSTPGIWIRLRSTDC